MGRVIVNISNTNTVSCLIFEPALDQHFKKRPLVVMVKVYEDCSGIEYSRRISRTHTRTYTRTHARANTRCKGAHSPVNDECAAN